MKDNKIRIGFSSFPDYSGNSKALFKALLLRNLDNYELVWFVKDIKIKEKLQNIGINVFCEQDSNFNDEFYKTQIVFLTHSDYVTMKSDNQIFIGLWHGLSPKRTGNSLDTPSAKEFANIYSNACDYLIAPSEFGRVIYSYIFKKITDDILIFPQPRYEFLKISNGKENLEKILNINLNNFNKLIMYAPTFRIGNNEKTGNISNINIINLKKYNEKELVDFLKKNNYLLILKMHPSEESILNIKENENIVILKDSIMQEKLITINEVLNCIDLLITDYSSIYIDYINLLRPILFLNTDIKEYNKDRGLLFNSNAIWYPGPIVNDINNFCKQTKKLLTDKNYYDKERINFNSLVNESYDLSNDKIIDEFIKNIKVKNTNINNDNNLNKKQKTKKYSILKKLMKK